MKRLARVQRALKSPLAAEMRGSMYFVLPSYQLPRCARGSFLFASTLP